MESLSENDLTDIDRKLTQHVPRRFGKAATILFETMEDEFTTRPGLPIQLYLGRLQGLVSAGTLEAKGDLRFIRFSEVRLHRTPSSNSDDVV